LSAARCLSAYVGRTRPASARAKRILMKFGSAIKTINSV
jgi:hypothetical protein